MDKILFILIKNLIDFLKIKLIEFFIKMFKNNIIMVVTLNQLMGYYS